MKRIVCTDGAVLVAETDEELVSATEDHMRKAHPELAGRLSREEILAMAEIGQPAPGRRAPGTGSGPTGRSARH